MIIGNSAAGVTAAGTLRNKSKDVRVTVIGDEGKVAYCRCRIPQVLAGTADFDRIVLQTKDSYLREGVKPVAGRVVELHPGQHRVLLGDGREMTYDKLLVATGAAPQVAKLPGREYAGIFGLRSYDDARDIAMGAEGTTHAVVLGGGLIGLKAAFALKKRGVRHVTVIVKSPHLMVKQLEEETASLLEKAFNHLGVEFVFRQDATSFIAGPGKGGRVGSVQLQNNREIKTQLVVSGKGTRPRTELVKESGGRVDRGIVVDEYLQTSLPDVYAAGDCIQVTDALTGHTTPSGLWPLAVEQGRYAALNILGQGSAYPPPLAAMNAIRFGNFSLVTAGRRDRGEQLALRHPASGSLKKFFVHDDRLLGYILINDIAFAGVYTALIRSGRQIPGLAGLLQSEQLPLNVPGLKHRSLYKAV